MKKLIVSLKTPSESLKTFAKVFKDVQNNIAVTPHYEIAFDNRHDFEKLIRNMDVLISILNFRPDSIYELSKHMNKDQSNLNKIICFFEYHGIVKIEEHVVNNRTLKRPIVDYQSIEFDLLAA